MSGTNLKGALVASDQPAAVGSFEGAIVPDVTTYTCISEEND